MDVDPISAASPDLSSPEQEALRESIKTLGQLVPIVMWQGRVLDGRKRLAACQALGLEPQMIEILDNATEHAAALNLLRTHYTTSQRAAYVRKLATLKRGQYPRSGNSTIWKGAMTTEDAARVGGVHAGAVYSAKRIARDGAPEVIQAVERGDLTLHAAQRIIEATPNREQAAAVAQVIAAKGATRNVAAHVLKTAKARHPTPRPRKEVIHRALAQLEHATDVLADVGAWETEAPHDATWLARVEQVMRTLRRIRRALRGRR